jgi:hypothetical protein
MTYRHESYEKDLIEQSEALIDLAQVLTDKLPSSITGRLAKALPDVIMDEIRSVQRRRDRSLESYEKEAKQHQAAVTADETKRQLLRNQVLCHIPAEWKAEVAEDRYDGPFIKAVGCSFSIKTSYSGGGRFSRGYASGTKLVASTNVESRGFPKKKDGTYSVDKAVAFVKEQQEIAAAREVKCSSDAAKLERFKQLVKPYSEYGTYSTEKRFAVSGTFEIFVKRTYGEEDRYMVQRTTTETVTAEQLAQILENEVGKVQRDKQEA